MLCMLCGCHVDMVCGCYVTVMLCYVSYVTSQVYTTKHPAAAAAVCTTNHALPGTPPFEKDVWGNNYA